MKTPIDLDYLKSILKYEPVSGEWRWIVSKGPRARVDTIAGTITPEGYRKINIDGKLYNVGKLSMFYMTGKFPTELIDHIDGCRDNNSWKNLRLVSPNDNCYNRVIKKRKRPDLPRWVHVNKSKYVSTITINKRKRHLGVFDNPQDAHEAAKNVAIQEGLWDLVCRSIS